MVLAVLFAIEPLFRNVRPSTPPRQKMPMVQAKTLVRLQIAVLGTIYWAVFVCWVWSL
jgi:hypothetical protein